MILEAEKEKIDENWIYPKCIIVLCLVAFMIGTMIPI